MADRMNWKRMATEVLEYTSRHPMREAHRGAIGHEDLGITVLFENRGRGLREDQLRAQLLYIRDIVATMGAEVLALDASGTEFSWVMLIRSKDVERLNRLAWQAYAAARGEAEGDTFDPAQRAIADRVIREHGFVRWAPAGDPGRAMLDEHRREILDAFRRHCVDPGATIDLSPAARETLIAILERARSDALLGRSGQDQLFGVMCVETGGQTAMVRFLNALGRGPGSRSGRKGRRLVPRRPAIGGKKGQRRGAR